MKKFVKFTGKTGKLICSDDPSNLEIGKVYEVITQTNLGWQLNYHLKGEKGEYNAKWFEEVKEEELK